MKIDFKFELDTRYMKHLKDKSYYNYNYYELDLSHYGDYILNRKCNILLEDMEDDTYYAYYSLGYFDEMEKFQEMWTWLDNWQMSLGLQEVE